MASDHGDAIDRLYGLPLEEFTAERDELAARLRREGDRDAAAEVKRLRKPSVAAWALNQVRRNEPEQVEALIETGRLLRQAQERLLAGGGRGELDRAAEDERRRVTELTGHAERELVAAGRAVSGAVHERLRETLRAVATEDEAREGLRAGRLLRDYTPSGLGGLIGAETARPRREDGGAERRARQLEDKLEKAREKQRDLEDEAARARRALRRARREAAQAAATLERAEAGEEQAKARVDEARRRTADLETALGRLAE